MVPPSSHRVSRVRRYSGFDWLLPVFAYETVTLCGRPSHAVLLTFRIPYVVHNPMSKAHGLGSSAFARRYLRNRCFFLFLCLLRCFSSAGSLCMAMCSPCSDGGSLRRVAPVRDPWVTGYLLLTTAYRSLSRLSSALSAKASTLCSLLLDLCWFSGSALRSVAAVPSFLRIVQFFASSL